MDAGQTVIKIILIVALAAFAVFLMLPGRGQRHVAIRRLLMIALLVLVVLAVIFPSAVTAVAHVLGVGRGADLLLYGLIVVFAGNSILVQRRHRNTEREITILARQLAILQAPTAAEVEAGRPAEPVPPAGQAAAAETVPVEPAVDGADRNGVS
ncbi:DUF2304 domain-containing protein [Leifsonia naganoensis]|uniref:DUF2304 domain-containing protein n=1 Tax=Leifsonia naganoensis TaxID=150025 RepID=A0A853DK27_9MICO|nr:DUF2304 domain-containing protein [Leifsonia naganoensis]NYK08718.1 hypothetical protein [Leifsonia naganoensis]